MYTDPATVSTQTPCISEACKFISGHTKKAKMEDLKKQMAYIPESFKKFYQDIIE